jgi:hypothetical protein
MKFNVATHRGFPPQTAVGLPEDRINVRIFAILTGVVKHVRRNEILHLLVVAIVAAAAITAVI